MGASGTAQTPSMDDWSSEGVLVLDVRGRVLRVNRAAAELMPGLPPQLDTLTFWDLLPEELAEEHHEPARRALLGGRPYTFLDHDAFAGRWVEFVMTPQDDVVVVHARNVAERHRLMGLLRESERRSQGLFESNPNVMWVFDAENLRVLAANRAAVRFYGYSRDEFTAMTANKLYPDSDERELRNSLPVLEGHPSQALEMRLCKQRKRDGQIQMVELSGLAVEWMGRRAVLVTVADVTARYLADAQLRQENEELEQRHKERTRALQDALRELGALQYAMSHDMLSPLHAVDGFTRVLGSQYGDALGDQGRHYLARIQAATEKMARMIEDLRMLTRVSRLTLHVQEFDLAPVCQTVLEKLRQSAPSRDVLLEIESPMWVCSDHELLAAALLALLDNAWKYTSKKPQTWIKVGLAVGRHPGEKLLFVTDNGAGFDPTYAAKLFTAFQRLHSSAEFSGTGLGLAVVQRVATRLGGQVWAESTPGAGATFYLSLPDPRQPTASDDDTPEIQVDVQVANR